MCDMCDATGPRKLCALRFAWQCPRCAVASFIMPFIVLFIGCNCNTDPTSGRTDMHCCHSGHVVAAKSVRHRQPRPTATYMRADRIWPRSQKTQATPRGLFCVLSCAVKRDRQVRVAPCRVATIPTRHANSVRSPKFAPGRLTSLLV